MEQPSRSIGWIGTGVMGRSMVRRLLAAGFDVLVSSRTRAKAEVLLREGARWANRPRDVAAESSAVVTMVGFPSDVEEAYLGRDGLLARESAGGGARLFIDMTTSSPALAARIAAAAAARAATAIDAPVSGGDVGARDGTLSIMVGGSRAGYDAALPILSRLGKKIVHQGDAGAGQHTKLVNQILIAGNMVGLCEGLLYAERAGLDSDRVLESVGSGAAASWSLANLAPRMLCGDFEPGFFIEHFIKDLGIALEEAERMGLSLPGLALAKRLYEAASERGLARKGTQALLQALRAEHGAR